MFFNNSNFFLDSVQLLCSDTIPGWQFEIIVRGLCPASFLVQQGKDDSTFQTETQKSWFNLSKDLIIDRLYIKKIKGGDLMNLECSYWCSFGLMLTSIQLYLNAKISILVAVVLYDNKKPNQLNFILRYSSNNFDHETRSVSLLIKYNELYVCTRNNW